ncbi:circadian clock-controlled protein [Hathewaya massiliensis]|uniref:circadian clock-controlled protein n=1 Tax=Hathewaya massiliensis TaxID=1964382 RepID=UPI001158F43E|nr:circadian clock-controlled protein [Hathewaya massiliensis]
MARKISVSFKETTKDLELYNIVNNMEDKSCEIKKILREFLIEKNNKNGSEIKSNNEDENINILDF